MSGRVDGYVTIEARVTTDKFEGQIADLEKKYEKKQIDINLTAKELSKAETDLEWIQKDLYKIDEQYNDINNKIKEQRALIDSVTEKNSDGARLVSSENYDTYSKAIGQITLLSQKQTLLSEKSEKIIQELDKQEPIVDRLNAKYEKQKSDLEQIKDKIAIAKGKQEELNKNTQVGTFNFSNMLKKVAKIGLAIFSIRSAYLAVRQAMNYITQDNEKLGAQLEGMKKSFYTAFVPVIEKVINLIRTLMAYINYIWNRLFGKDLFKNVVTNTDKASNNLASGAKSAKEINKQLAGFDEANVLTKPSDTSGGGGGGGATGTTNLGLDKIKIPTWLVKIMDWVDAHPKLAKIIFGLAAFTLFGGWSAASGIMGFISQLLGKKGAGALATGASGLLGILGTLILIAGTVWVVKLAVDGINEVINAAKELDEAHDHRDKLIEDTIKKDDEYIDKAKEVIASDKTSTEQKGKYAKGVDTVTKSTRDLIEQNVGGTLNQRKYMESLEKSALKMDELYRSTNMGADAEYEYYKMLKDQFNPMMDNSYKLISNNKNITDNLKESFDKLDKKYATQYSIELQQKGSTTVINTVNKVKDAFSKLGTTISEAFKKGAQAGLKVSDLSKIFHAEGGIVNMPRRGVPVHYAGEAGREGIIPMDNQQQMALLGQEIAKYVNITNYVTNNVDSRKLNTILKQSENRERLANNW